MFGSIRPNRRRRRLGLEALEGRELMSLGFEFTATVNTTTRNAQFGSANASSSNGSSVAVWVDTFVPANHDIRAQRFDAAGGKVGPEIVVVSTGLEESQPSVGMDNLGNFVVAWRVILVNGDTNVLAQRFNSAGQRVGSVVPVGVGTKFEHDPSVGMDNNGNFIVAYTRDTSSTNPDVFAKKFDVNNTLTNVVNVDIDPNIADHARIAVMPDGRFDIAYEHAFDAKDHNIELKQFTPSGGFVWLREMANGKTQETHPAVSVDNNGNAVVAWRDGDGAGGDILYRRADVLGNVGSPHVVLASPLIQANPSVAMKRTGGSFVVAYDLFTSTSTHVHVAEISASDRLVSLFDAGTRFNPVVSINGVGQYLLTYTSNDSGDLNIRRRIGRLT